MNNFFFFGKYFIGAFHHIPLLYRSKLLFKLMAKNTSFFSVRNFYGVSLIYIYKMTRTFYSTLVANGKFFCIHIYTFVDVTYIVNLCRKILYYIYIGMFLRRHIDCRAGTYRRTKVKKKNEKQIRKSVPRSK